MYAWSEISGPPYGFYVLHRNRCLREFLAENSDRTVYHRGSPYWHLDIPWFGDRFVLGVRPAHVVELRLRAELKVLAVDSVPEKL